MSRECVASQTAHACTKALGSFICLLFRWKHSLMQQQMGMVKSDRTVFSDILSNSGCKGHKRKEARLYETQP